MRNRAITLTLLPVIIFLWMIGWSLFWIGSQNQPQKKQKRIEGTSATVVIHEECNAKARY